MKDRRHWQDGVELFLDNRQIFLLFFSSAVVLSLVFALGVVVGKRVERQPAMEPAADPLAMLDQLGSSEGIDDNLTFHEKLTVEPKAPADDARIEVEDEPSQKAPLPAAAEPEHPEPQKSEPAKPEKLARAKRESAPKQKDSVTTKKSPVTKAPAAKAQEKQTKKILAVKETDTTSTTQGKYTLQLSSFQDRHEAQQFMRKLRVSGMQPYMIPANIPGRGVWFRVRVGSYGSWDEALAAKEIFEREQQIVAYVAKN